MEWLGLRRAGHTSWTQPIRLRQPRLEIQLFNPQVLQSATAAIASMTQANSRSPTFFIIFTIAPLLALGMRKIRTKRAKHMP